MRSSRCKMRHLFTRHRTLPGARAVIHVSIRLVTQSTRSFLLSTSTRSTSGDQTLRLRGAWHAFISPIQGRRSAGSLPRSYLQGPQVSYARSNLPDYSESSNIEESRHFSLQITEPGPKHGGCGGLINLASLGEVRENREQHGRSVLDSESPCAALRHRMYSRADRPDNGGCRLVQVDVRVGDRWRLPRSSSDSFGPLLTQPWRRPSTSASGSSRTPAGSLPPILRHPLTMRAGRAGTMGSPGATRSCARLMRRPVCS